MLLYEKFFTWQCEEEESYESYKPGHRELSISIPQAILDFALSQELEGIPEMPDIQASECTPGLSCQMATDIGPPGEHGERRVRTADGQTVLMSELIFQTVPAPHFINALIPALALALQTSIK